MKDVIKTIGITETSKECIRILAKKYKFADLTILEYLLRGELPIEEFKQLWNAKIAGQKKK